jgi:hypothetical protein
MLGCQDFCGYYDWTFHFIRRCWGQAAVELLWAEAIGGESQRHYAQAAAQRGLRGLYEAWVGTGKAEHCDWTFTLDENRNVLRWDMRACPSKGFLTRNDLAADEDYCNHCMGWIIPMFESLGVEIVEHEHNHCGQCWATMRMKDRPSETLKVAFDIRNDPRWRHGYLDRWNHNRAIAPYPAESPSCDYSEVLESLLRRVLRQTLRSARTIVADVVYNDRKQCAVEPAAVLIDCPPADLAATSARYAAAPAAERPLLLHAYLPGTAATDFVTAGLPRPLPILPLLIRGGQYTHRPGGPHPTNEDFLTMLAAAIMKAGREEDGPSTQYL